MLVTLAQLVALDQQAQVQQVQLDLPAHSQLCQVQLVQLVQRALLVQQAQLV